MSIIGTTQGEALLDALEDIRKLPGVEGIGRCHFWAHTPEQARVEGCQIQLISLSPPATSVVDSPRNRLFAKAWI